MDVAKLFTPLSISEFREHHYLRSIYSAPARAQSARRLLDWNLLESIFETGHPDCWLTSQGRLAKKSGGVLNRDEAMAGFCSGLTVVVRHSEIANARMSEVAAEFARQFENDPIDIQLYATPANCEGFDWHYDIEDVFVIQSSGSKEFTMKVPPELPPLSKVDLTKFPPGAQEVRCQLEAGDFLYIPAGVWHKARAIAPSFHISVGIMSSQRVRF